MSRQNFINWFNEIEYHFAHCFMLKEKEKEKEKLSTTKVNASLSHTHIKSDFIQNYL